MVDREPIRQRWKAFGSKLDERGRRLFAAAEVRAAGHGGLIAVARITGLARSTIGRGLKELDAPALAGGRVRREGGGRHEIADGDLTLVSDLERLVEPMTLGDPERPLKWVSKSHVKLAEKLREEGHEVSPNTVARLLDERLGYARQVNRKTQEGANHPDRNAQFEHINAKVVAAQAAGEPVISVDTKKHAPVKTGEGTDRQLSQWRQRLPPERRSLPRQGPRFRRQDARQGRPLRRL